MANECKKKKIWIVGHYTMPPEYEVRIKTLMWAKHLMLNGYEVILISASTLHNTDINLIESNEPYILKTYDQYRFVHIKCDQYEGNGLLRVKNLLQFSKRFKKHANNFGKLPDVILAADVHCVNYKPMYQFAKKNNIKFIVDIRDLWPESIVEYLNFSGNNPIIKYLYREEKRMYQIADEIIFSMEGGKDYVIEKGWETSVDLDKVHYINNGVDLEEFDFNKEHYQIEDKDLVDNNIFKVIYVGSIRKANNLGLLLDSAKLIKEKGLKKIKFLIWGDGDEVPKLKQRCMDEKIDNIAFKGKIEKKNIPYIVSNADLNMYILKESPLFRFGLSLNKSFEYFAAGKPVVASSNSGYSIIDRYECGVCLDEFSIEALSNAIVRLSELDYEKYIEYCKNARMAAEEFDFKRLTKKLIEVIEK